MYELSIMLHIVQFIVIFIFKCMCYISLTCMWHCLLIVSYIFRNYWYLHTYQCSIFHPFLYDYFLNPFGRFLGLYYIQMRSHLPHTWMLWRYTETYLNICRFYTNTCPGWVLRKVSETALDTRDNRSKSIQDSSSWILWILYRIETSVYWWWSIIHQIKSCLQIEMSGGPITLRYS